MRQFRSPRYQRGFIGTAAAVVGAGAAVAGLVGARQQSKAAQGANEASANYYNWLANVGQQQWQIYQQNVIPQLQKLSAAAPLDEERLAGEAATETKSQYDTGRATLERQLSATRSPADPGFQAALAAYSQGEAPAVSQAITASRNTTKQLNFERQLQAVGAWQGLPQGTQAVGTAAGGYGNVARTDIATGQALNQATGQATYGAINLAGALSRMRPQPAPGASPTANYGGPGSFFMGYPPNAAGGYSGGMAGPNTDWTGTNWNYRDGGAISAPAFSPVPEYNPRQLFKDGGDVRGTPSGAGEYAPVAMFDDGGRVLSAVDARRRPHPGGDAVPPAMGGARGAEGGRIEGPGTGTSDSVSAIKKPGTFIIPHDVVKAKGSDYFDKMLEKHGVRPGEESDDGSGVRVRLSNGEYSIPPHIVRREGTELFNSLLQKFHHPIEGETVGMANGGAIRRRGLPTSVEDAIYRAMPTHVLSRPRWAH